MDLNVIRYAQVWEDADVLRGALEVGPGERVLSIAAAGDNAFSLLLDDPEEVVAVDFSPAQIALVELKMAALRVFDLETLWRFAGVTSGADRHALYRRLRGDLSLSTRAFFDARPEIIDRGLIHGGKFERYFQLFRRVILPLVESRSTVRAFLDATDRETQREIFSTRWDNPRWRTLFRLFFGRVALGRLGRDPSLFEHIDVDHVGDTLLQRAERALTEIPVQSNFFVEYILTGGYSRRHGLPAWLAEHEHATIRDRLDRLTLVMGELAATLVEDERGFDAYNLSDCFEWMSPGQTASLYSAIASSARDGARLCQWNLFARRECPRDVGRAVRRLEERERQLHARDRAFFYERVVIEQMGAAA